MTNYSSGHDAEKAAAKYLVSKNYKVLNLNWSTRYCEIDVVATKNKTVYFVEVKYRRTANFGDGLDYITAKKLKQMNFAAEMWVYQNKWDGNYQLAVVAMSGPNYQEIEFLAEL